MRWKPVCISVVAIAVGFGGLTAKADEPKDLQKQNAELKHENAELKKRIETLEAILRDEAVRNDAARMRELPQLRLPTTQPRVVIPYSSGKTDKKPSMPPGSIERKMDGITYYIIPLDAK